MVAGSETARRSDMANIGSFKKSGQEFQGEIVTLSLQTKGVRIVPETDRTNDNAPSYRIYVGRAEIGAAWSKRSTERPRLPLGQAGRSELQRSDLRQPLRRRRCRAYTLIWSRSASRTATEAQASVRTPRSSERGASLSLDPTAPARLLRRCQDSSLRRRQQSRLDVNNVTSSCDSVGSAFDPWVAPFGGRRSFGSGGQTNRGIFKRRRLKRNRQMEESQRTWQHRSRASGNSQLNRG